MARQEKRKASRSRGKFVTREMSVTDLKAAPHNPRKISKPALDALRSSIKRFGLVQPIVWNERTGHVVAGHQRLKAIKERRVSVVVDLPEVEEKALNVALNSPHVAGAFDGSLAGVLADIDDELPDLFGELRFEKLEADGSGSEDDFDLKEWDGSDLEMDAIFEFTAPIELQAKIRKLLERNFPGVRFDESVIVG